MPQPLSTPWSKDKDFTVCPIDQIDEYIAKGTPGIGILLRRTDDNEDIIYVDSALDLRSFVDAIFKAQPRVKNAGPTHFAYKTESSDPDPVRENTRDFNCRLAAIRIKQTLKPHLG